MIDGILGSGKSTILKTIHEWAQTCEHKTFRLQDWTQAQPPRFEDISEFDVYFTYEPTRTWVGSAIRYELSREDEPYGGEELAHAFALDRQIMYRRLIIPALNAGKTIIQDRGVSSSLALQPVMNKTLSLEKIMELPGNRLALSYAPDILILTRVEAETAFERIQKRNEESKGVFADLSFLKQQEERFASEWFKDLFASRGTRIVELDTSGSLEKTQKQAAQLINHLLTTC